MLFNSFQYAIFLPVVFLLYWKLPHRFRQPLLLAASYYFYMCWSVRYVVLILFTTVVSYAAARLIETNKDCTRRKWILFGTLVACLGVLFVFKYLNFFYETLDAVLRVFSIQLAPMTLKLLLPVGISFYTFQTLSYVIDVFRGDVEAEKNFWVYATFVSFFPQLVAGPIERTSNLLPQIKAEHTFDYDQASYGMKLMAWGFFKKLVIADNLSVYVDTVFNDVWNNAGFAFVLAAFFFTIQIYCDFSGYSDIARGTAKLLGIELMENFKSPYLSASIKEFWSRWHISLSTWFRDYVYIPLGGNRTATQMRAYCNLFITFLVSGLWHGASWTFVLWGGMHGAAQIVEKALKLDKTDHLSTGIRVLRTLLVFVFAGAAWVLFRAESFGEIVHIYTHLLSGITSPVSYLKEGFRAIGMNKISLVKAVLVYLPILFAYDTASLRGDPIKTVSALRWRWIIYVAFTSLIALLSYYSRNAAFIYFQF